MRSSVYDTTRTIAEAMLAGSPDPGGVTARMAAVLGDSPAWLHDVARDAIAHFGERWASVEPGDLARLVAEAP
ncbi:RNA-directed DNA polymerase, partial [Paraburkholderia sp. Se-20369]|nr:RNA-directed DNA polymerase [Paraburkholderia sp. Se-20369]